MRNRLMTLLALSLAACGGDDDGGGTAVDAAQTVDAASDIDAPVSIDAPNGRPPGDLCSTAEPITLTGGAATITATSAAPYANDYEPGVCAKVNSAGPDRVHSITVPNGQRLTATVDPTSATFDPGIFLIAAPGGCDVMPIVCLAENDAGGDGQDDAITFTNTGAAPVDVFIMIDGFRMDGDAYTLTVNVAPAPQL